MCVLAINDQFRKDCAEVGNKLSDNVKKILFAIGGCMLGVICTFCLIFFTGCVTTEGKLAAKDIRTDDLSPEAREALLCAQFLTATNKNGGDQAGKEIVCLPIFQARAKQMDESRLQRRNDYCQSRPENERALCWERLNPVK